MSNAKQAKTVVCRDVEGREYVVPVEKLKWRPSAYAIVVHDGKILLTKQHGKYELPGGGVDFGELPEAAVLRETFEETGIRAVNPRLAGCLSNCFKLPGSGEFVQSLLLFYGCDFVGGELSISGLDSFERAWTELPEWRQLDELDVLEAGASFDWRAMVRASLQL